MKVYDVLLLLRARLRDVDYNDLRFSDNELIDYLRHEQNRVISEFGLNIQEFVFRKGEVEINLPSECLCFKLAKCGEKKLPLVTYQEFLENSNRDLCVYAKNLKTYCLNKEARREVKIYLSLSSHILEEKDDLITVIELIHKKQEENSGKKQCNTPAKSESSNEDKSTSF